MGVSGASCELGPAPPKVHRGSDVVPAVLTPPWESKAYAEKQEPAPLPTARKAPSPGSQLLAREVPEMGCPQGLVLLCPADSAKGQVSFPGWNLET